MLKTYLPSSGFLKLLHASLPFQSLSLIIGEHWTVAICSHHKHHVFLEERFVAMTLSWRAFLKGLRDLHLAENLQSTYTYQFSTSRRSLDVAIFSRKRKRCWHSQQSVDWKLLVGSCQLTFKRLQVWHPSERSGPPCHPASKGWHNTCYDIPPY